MHPLHTHMGMLALAKKGRSMTFFHLKIAIFNLSATQNHLAFTENLDPKPVLAELLRFLNLYLEALVFTHIKKKPLVTSPFDSGLKHTAAIWWWEVIITAV